MFEVVGKSKFLCTHILFPSLTEEMSKLTGAALGFLIYGIHVRSASLTQSHWGLSAIQYGKLLTEERHTIHA